MKTMNRRAVLGLLATTAALWLPAAAPAAESNEVTFGIIATEASSNLKTAWQPLLDDMHKATGLKVTAYFAPDYAGVIEAMRFNKVQVGWFGNKSAMEAVDRANGEIFAKAVAKDGSEGYYSLLIVNKDSPLKSLADVLKARASLTLGFGDPNSTSGTVVPGYYAFAKNGVDPLKDFKRTVRANHETNLLAVVNKQVDVATNNTENWDRFAITHPEQIKNVREIWRSPHIPSDPLVWRKDLDASAKQKIRDFLLGYGKQPRELKILNDLTYSAFRASSDAQLVMVRSVELAKKRMSVEADTQLSADEKTKQLQEIDKKLDEMNKQLVSQAN
jgi:phosphonate transport system substrate-binding protein